MKVFLHVFKKSISKHDADNPALYVYSKEGDREELAPAQDFNWGSLENKEVYTTDVRYLEHQGVFLKNYHDLSFIYYYKYGIGYEMPQIPLTAFYARNYAPKEYTNFLVPKTFYISAGRKLYEDLGILMNENLVNECLDTFYKKQISIFQKIESKGVMYNGELKRTKYNFFTATGRPSNTFDGINFSGLNKKDGSRSAIDSRYKDGVLIEIDFQSYHPRLIADMIDYSIPVDISVYDYLAQRFYDTTTPTDEQIKKSKKKTFYKLYGNGEDSSITFFKEIDKFRKTIWKAFEAEGMIESTISNRPIIKANNPQILSEGILFNYLMQLRETEQNVEILSNLLKSSDKLFNSIILYIYDAILLDIRKEDVGSIIQEVEKNFPKKFPIQIKIGKTYNDMELFTKNKHTYM